MIRVAVIAETHAEAARLSDRLRELGGIEVVQVQARPGFRPRNVDVVIADSTSDSDVVAAVGLPLILLHADANTAFPQAPEVKAVLPPDATAAELMAAILAAAEDLIVLTAAQARRWLPEASAGVREDTFEPSFEHLTPRELEVLRLMSDGLGNKRIAAQLSISEHTAKFHVAQILAKFDAGSRAEAVAIGMRRGLLPV